MNENPISKYLRINNESANKLAKRAGVSQPTLSNLMANWGKPHGVSVQTAHKLSRATGIPLEVFAIQPTYNNTNK